MLLPTLHKLRGSSTGYGTWNRVDRGLSLAGPVTLQPDTASQSPRNSHVSLKAIVAKGVMIWALHNMILPH